MYIESYPGTLCVCIDSRGPAPLSGRFYHRYRTGPVVFTNVLQMIMTADDIFDQAGLLACKDSLPLRCLPQTHSAKSTLHLRCNLKRLVIENSRSFPVLPVRMADIPG